MRVKAVHTVRFTPPKDDLMKLLNAIPKLENGQIIAISSKVVSIIEGRCRDASETNLEALIRQESTQIYRPSKYESGTPVLTLKGGILTETGGIDKSNANGYYILLPKHPLYSSFELWKALKKRDRLKEVGVIITDSHAIPGKRGAVGMAIASYGFVPVSYARKSDLFGRKTMLGATNVAESLAAAAVAEMGEGDEQTPIAIIDQVRDVHFNRRAVSLYRQKRYEYVSKAKDVYSPLLIN